MASTSSSSRNSTVTFLAPTSTIDVTGQLITYNNDFTIAHFLESSPGRTVSKDFLLELGCQTFAWKFRLNIPSIVDFNSDSSSDSSDDERARRRRPRADLSKCSMMIRTNDAPRLPVRFRFFMKRKDGVVATEPVADLTLQGRDEVNSADLDLGRLIRELNPITPVLPRDSLTLAVEITGYSELEEHAVPDRTCLLSPPYDFSDFVIHAGERSIHVHRVIVAEQSSVFAAMFRTDMKEKRQGSMRIEATDPDVVEDMIQFMYAGSFSKLKLYALPRVKALYSLSSQYNFIRLRNACSANLQVRLSKDTVLPVLAFLDAEMEIKDGLKDAAKSFFLAFADEICFSPEWTTFREEHGDLAHGLLLSFVQANSRKRRLDD